MATRAITGTISVLGIRNDENENPGTQWEREKEWQYRHID